MSWSSSLRPASWRGVPFAVLTSDADLTRRTAVHEYPWRDDVWAEDLGAGRNTYAIAGRLVGDDAIALRDQMADAVSIPGPGELIHPTFGSLIVACIGFRPSEAWDEGRVINLEFLFVRASDRQFPAAALDTGGAVKELADVADAASEGSFVDRAVAMYESGREAVNQAVTTAQTYVGAAMRTVNDATSVVNSVGAVVPGVGRVLGRYTSAARSLVGSAVSSAGRYVNQAATARSRVEALVTNVQAAAKRL